MEELYPKHERLIEEAKQRDKGMQELHKLSDDYYKFLLKVNLRHLTEDTKKFEDELSDEFKKTSKYKEGMAFRKDCIKRWTEYLKETQKEKVKDYQIGVE